MRYDSDGNLLAHRYDREKKWFGWGCKHCSFVEDAEIHSVIERDREYESHFLAVAEDYAAHLGAPTDGAFTRLVNHRSDGQGVRSYGDVSFLTDQRDLLTECREECGDAGVYSMFECEKQGYEPHDEEFIHLAQAAAHAALADYHIRLAQQLQRVA
jgi:hypothetical protein